MEQITAHQVDPIRRALRNLPPSGPSGFEWLLCELLSRLTDRRFFVAAAGSQQGRDLSTGQLGGTWIAVEAKRYQKRTSFDKGQLLGELLELSFRSPHPDLWVLITTGAVSDQLISSLRQGGLRTGVEVEIIHAPDDHPGELEFLCASEPDVTARYLPKTVESALQALREHDQYIETLKSLRDRFSSETLGFDHFRRAAQSWFRESLEVAEQARARLGGQPLSLLAPTANFVGRMQPTAALERWWQCWPQDPRPFIMLGEEGVGKTWAVAAWANDVAEEAPETIMMFVSSSDIKSTDPFDLLTSRLGAIENRIGAEYLKRRLENWIERADGGAPTILLVVDGINERPTFEWRSLFDALNVGPWFSRVAMVVTCRPGFWNKAMFMPDQEVAQCSLQSFNDMELEEALRKHGHSLEEFDERMVVLLRKPRYLALAMKHHRRLEETGDFTIDRLLYEDWKDRLERKRLLTVTDNEFRDFLGSLAQYYQDGLNSLSRREIEELLPRSAGSDLTELLTGGLFTVTSGLRQQFKIEPEWLTHSLGLLLASHVAEITEVAHLKEELAHFLEPHLEIDQQGDILAAAVLYSLFTPNYGRPARLTLLHAWVSRQNHSSVSINRLKGYVPVAADDYLELLECSTLAGSLDRRAIERLEYALLAWRTLPKVERLLVTATVRWVGLIHPAGFDYMRPTKSRTGAKESRTSDDLRDAIEERAGRRLLAGQSLSLDCGSELHVVSSDRFAWLADSALFFLSTLPARKRLIPLRQWALSRAVLGSAREWNQVAWLLRSTATADFEDALFAVLEPLFRSSMTLSRSAAAELLACLNTPRAVARRREWGAESLGIGADRRNEVFDPCTDWSYRWRKSDCEACCGRDDLTDIYVARKLSRLALEPGFELPAVALPRIRRALSTIDFSKVWGDFARTSAESDLEGIEPVIAATLPGALVSAYRTVVRTQVADETSWGALSLSLEKVRPLLNRRRERAPMTKRLQEVHQLNPKNNDQLIHWECDLFSACIANEPPTKQLNALFCRPAWTFDT